MTRRFVTRRGLRLSYLDSAPEDGDARVVLLLHGFPDEARMWGPLIERLPDGLRILAPDTVGCGRSDMAPRVRDYDVDEILGDALAALDDAGVHDADVVGHDWGAALAWFLAMRHPERVRSLCAVSVGHIDSYVHGGLRQKLMSWYIGYFHMAGVAERLLPGRGPLGLRRVFPGHPQIDDVLDRLGEPGRLTAALRIYRANVLQNVLLGRHPHVRCPVLAIHSRDDVLLGERQVRESRSRVTGPFRYEQLDGTHWVPQEQPDRLAALVTEHLRSVAPLPGRVDLTPQRAETPGSCSS